MSKRCECGEALERRVMLSGTMFVTNPVAGTISAFTTTGATVKTKLVSGLDEPTGIAISGSDLFVANEMNGTIGEYTTGGAAVKTKLISGLDQPTGIAISGKDIFVANTDDGIISEFTTAGKVVKTTLISGLDAPALMAISGSDMFIACEGTGTVAEFTTAGVPVKTALITGLSKPSAIAISGKDLFVVNSNSTAGTIGEYSTAGKLVKATLVGGLIKPVDVAVFGSDLIVTEEKADNISEFTTGGAKVKSPLIGVSTEPAGICVETSPTKLKLGVTETSTKLATGSATVTSGNAPLTTTATVTSKMDFWTGVSESTTGTATTALTSASSNAFDKLGIISPNGKVTMTQTFKAVGDAVKVDLAFTADPGVMDILDTVLPVSAWKASSSLPIELSKIAGQTALGLAVETLDDGSTGKISKSTADKDIAEDTGFLFANHDAQLKIVESALGALGITLTSSQQTTLDSESTMEGLANTLVTEGQQFVSDTGDKDNDVTFTAAAD